MLYIKTFLSSPMLSTKISIKPNLFQPYLWHIYTSSSSSRLSIAQTCVLKYHPKHADSTKNYPLIQSLFFLIVDIVKFAVTFGLTSRMVTIRAQAHLTSETSRWQKREKLCRAIQCKKTTPKVMSQGSQSAKIWSLITNSTILMYRDI